MKWKFFASLALGILAAALLWLHTARAQKEIDSRYVMTRVLQARRYVPQGKIVAEDAVEEKEIPLAYLQPTALRSLGELKDKAGKFHFRASGGLLKGEQITRSRLAEADAFQGLAWTLSPNETALALNLSPEEAVAGLLQPGDFVNVLATLDGEAGPKAATKLLFSHVQVVAVGDRVWDPSGASLLRPEAKNMPNETILVTLRLTPRQAALSVLAAERGSVTLTLASPLETAPPSSLTVFLNDVR